jgi:hypothetical protein
MHKYRISYAGRPALSDPYGLARFVFSTEFIEAESDGFSVTVTFASPQTPADLGPLVKVEILPSE